MRVSSSKHNRPQFESPPRASATRIPKDANRPQANLTSDLSRETENVLLLIHLSDESRRGLRGKGALLMVTSHANSTSPVLRGKWVLENILGSPVPPPPPDVPALKENEAGVVPLTMRAQMAQHRANPVCDRHHPPHSGRTRDAFHIQFPIARTLTLAAMGTHVVTALELHWPQDGERVSWYRAAWPQAQGV